MHEHLQHLEAISLRVANHSRTIAAAREQLAVIEAHHVLDVQGAINELGKPQYPNEEARKAALTLRLTDDIAYRQLSLRIRDAEEARAGLAAEHERLRQEFKIYLLDRQEQIARLGEGHPAAVFPYK